MNNSFIPAQKQLPEMTFKVILISIILTLVLAASNAYLALKVGILTSASIPAAILSMGILRWFKNSNILENNLIQTAASAGEAVAGGIVYTVPAMILIHAWVDFNYWQNVFIALTGGILGVMFSIPLRNVLVNDPTLSFPEGKAISAVLIAGTSSAFKLKPIIMGAGLGALIAFAQTGIKIFGTALQGWVYIGKSLWGFGVGLSATMLGVGYLVGFEIGASLFIGAVLSWGILIPILSHFYVTNPGHQATIAAISLWGNKIRYVGIGAMVTAGLWTLGALSRPFVISLKEAGYALGSSFKTEQLARLRTDQDIPLHYVCLGLLMCLMAIYYLFSFSFPMDSVPLSQLLQSGLVWLGLIYVVLAGFIAVAICCYFSGMVGVTASPGSSVILAALIIITLLLKLILITSVNNNAIADLHLYAASIAILVTAVITSAAAIANDNIQDLKVGQLVGATPWKQQIMLLLGVVAASLIIPPIMRLLFHVYGIGNVLPHAGMNIADALPAPPAAMMAALTNSIFSNQMPWNMLGLGVGIGLALIIVHKILRKKNIKYSVLGVATGMYLPLTISTPIFIGSLMQKWLAKTSEQDQSHANPASLIACGLVTGAALMDVLLAIPFALLKSPEALSIMPASYSWIANLLGIAVFAGLIIWINRQTKLNK